ncbi:Sgta [Symbiodinium microadriaticum]|nr:Sgta [Symbiodinium microadriaticum]
MSLRSLPAAPADNHAFVVQVAVGKAHSMLLTDEGVIYSWGTNNQYGQLGRACHNQDKMLKPAPIIGGIKQLPEWLSPKLQVRTTVSRFLKEELSLHGATTRQQLRLPNRLSFHRAVEAGQLGVDGFSAAAPESELVPSLVDEKFQNENSKRDLTLLVRRSQLQRPLSTLRVRSPLTAMISHGPERAVKLLKETSLCARSCSCGPESSACVTVRGEVYVWGAISYYMLGAQKRYDKAENCTVPVCIKSLPREAYAEDAGPDQVSVYKDLCVCCTGKLNIEDDMANLITSLKSRSSQLVSVRRMKRADAADRPSRNEDEFDVEELRQLNNDFQKQKKDLENQMEDLQKQLSTYRLELAHMKRELTVCDQQDAALTETARNLEENGQPTGTLAVQDKVDPVKPFAFRGFVVSKPLDVQDAFWRSVLERAAAASFVFYNLAWRFHGLHEIFEVSERALQDVSSSLKEVRGGLGYGTVNASLQSKREELESHSVDETGRRKQGAAASSGDGIVLEQALEDNLQLRKELNALIQEKRERAESGAFSAEGTEVAEEGWDAAERERERERERVPVHPAASTSSTTRTPIRPDPARALRLLHQAPRALRKPPPRQLLPHGKARERKKQGSADQHVPGRGLRALRQPPHRQVLQHGTARAAESRE